MIRFLLLSILLTVVYRSLSRLAQGIADDFLSTLYLATKVPVVIAPAMNVNMWENPATQANLAKLKERGVRVVQETE